MRCGGPIRDHAAELSIVEAPAAFPVWLQAAFVYCRPLGPACCRAVGELRLMGGALIKSVTNIYVCIDGGGAPPRAHGNRVDEKAIERGMLGASAPTSSKNSHQSRSASIRLTVACMRGRAAKPSADPAFAHTVTRAHVFGARRAGGPPHGVQKGNPEGDQPQVCARGGEGVLRAHNAAAGAARGVACRGRIEP